MTQNVQEADLRARCKIEGAAEARTRTTAFCADALEIIALDQEACYQVQLGNIASLKNMLVEDAFQFPPGAPIVVGRDAMMAETEEDAKVELYVWEPVDVFVSESKDMDWTYGFVNIKLEGQPQWEGKYVTVWRKENGVWKNIVNIRNEGR